jgi:hypothetical protein
MMAVLPPDRGGSKIAKRGGGRRWIAECEEQLWASWFACPAPEVGAGVGSRCPERDRNRPFPPDLLPCSTSLRTRRKLIRLDNQRVVFFQRLPQIGDQVRVRVRVQAPTQFDAKQMIELQYGRGNLIIPPVRVDLMRAV